MGVIRISARGPGSRSRGQIWRILIYYQITVRPPAANVGLWNGLGAVATDHGFTCHGAALRAVLTIQTGWISSNYLAVACPYKHEPLDQLNAPARSSTCLCFRDDPVEPRRLFELGHRLGFTTLPAPLRPRMLTNPRTCGVSFMTSAGFTPFGRFIMAISL